MDSYPTDRPYFLAARPVWPAGREKEMNRFVGFRAIIDVPEARAVLHVTASSSYRAFVNGRYVGCGPARAPHGHFRVDSWVLDLELGPNVLAIEAVGYNVNSYYLLDQPAFLQAEVLAGGRLIAATGAGAPAGKAPAATGVGAPAGKAPAAAGSEASVGAPAAAGSEANAGAPLPRAGANGEVAPANAAPAVRDRQSTRNFEAMLLDDHVQRVERYSVARTFSEAFRLHPDAYGWRTEATPSSAPVACAILPAGILLPRRVPYPKFDVLRPAVLSASGQFTIGTLPEDLYRDWTLTELGPDLKGYFEDELDVIPSLEIQSFRPAARRSIGEAAADHLPLELGEGSWHLFDFGVNRTGFIGLALSCRQPARLFVTFDEILIDEDIDPRRLRCINIISIELEAGNYVVETFEPYTLRYLKVMSIEGTFELRDVSLREFAHPTAGDAVFESGDERLNSIFAAGRETFRQNAVDLLMDCPSRERAGWLCDSFFTARAEYDLTGASFIEHVFLENYLLPARFEHLPEGMLPMNYPADHNNGKFIPNWPLWLVLQIEEYLARSGDRTLVDAFEPKVAGLFDYFLAFENEDLLLERLDGWIFMEWSAANDLVQDVNFPTNMLYAAALDCAGRLYDHPLWREKARVIRRAVLVSSFDGEYFADRAIRTSGGLVRGAERTEICQYYAFYFDLVTPGSHGRLWKTLRDRCGPEVSSPDRPPLLPANMLNGHYLRLELLSRYGSSEQALREMISYFLPMAEASGTLWEHDASSASCNHGFASHVVHGLYRDAVDQKKPRL